MVSRAADIEVRRLRADEAAVFKALRLEALTLEPASYASSLSDWAGLSEQDWVDRLEDAAVHAVFRDGEPVGLMGVMRQKSSKMKHRAMLVMVYVRAGERGRGTAKALLQAMLDHARTTGVRQIELLASAENDAALGFYRREGFSEIGRIPAGVIHEGREIDDVMMMRRLA